MDEQDSGNDRNSPAPRDRRGRYVKGASGNRAGKPRGCLNRATRAVAALIDGEAEALWRLEIDRAKAGDRTLLMHCNDRTLGPRRGQPVLFPMSPVETAGDIAAAIGAVLEAAARGLITPQEAESLARAAEAGAQAVAAGERIGRARFAEEQAAFERRFELAVCAVLYFAVREIDEEAGGFHNRLRELCKPILCLGESALAALAAIHDRPERLNADLAFALAHPPRPDREASPFAAEMGRCVADLVEYLDRNGDWLDREIDEREARGEAPALKYRTGLFERLLGFEPPPVLPGGDIHPNST